MIIPLCYDYDNSVSNSHGLFIYIFHPFFYSQHENITIVFHRQRLDHTMIIRVRRVHALRHHQCDQFQRNSVQLPSHHFIH